jgi:NitT/TauT family transport system permease protein
MSNLQVERNSESVYRRGQRSVPRAVQTAPYYVLSALAMLTIWLIAGAATGESARRFLLPTPTAVLNRLLSLAARGRLGHHVTVTLTEMGLGLLTGTCVALVLAYAVAHSRLVAYVLEPVIVTSQAVPIVALAPLLTVWFGPGLASKVVVCALIVFFPILVSVTAGLSSIDPSLRDLFRLLRASRSQELIHLEIPAALPAFLSGMKVGGTLSGMGAVVGEFVASTEGIGYLVKQGQNLYDIPMMFAAIFVLMALATTVYGLLSATEYFVVRWQR